MALQVLGCCRSPSAVPCGCWQQVRLASTFPCCPGDPLSSPRCFSCELAARVATTAKRPGQALLPHVEALEQVPPVRRGSRPALQYCSPAASTGGRAPLLLLGASTGVNWLIQILSDLIFTTTQNKPVSTELPFIECGDPDKYQRMKQIPSPRILATHLNYDCLPKSIFKNKAKILVLFRNPKDTAVSFFHFHNNVPSIPSYSSWDEFFSEFMNGKVGWGSYFDHAVTWNKHIEDENTMIITYEDLKENLTASVKQIAEFFGFSPTAEQIQSIADRATFQAVKDKAQETHGAVGSILFRKGAVGDWKNLFTEAQNQEMDAKFKVCLEGTKLGVKLKYDVYCKA